MTEPDPLLAIQALAQAPWGVLMLQAERIVWANESLAQSLQTVPEKLVGMTGDESGLEALFEKDSEQLVLRSSEGESRRLKRHRHSLPEFDAEVHYFEDITEHLKLEVECQQLRDLVKTLDTRDPETGLMNNKAILQSLDGQISRSRRYGNPLSAIRLCLEPPPDREVHRITLGDISQELKMQLRWADQLGRLDQGSLLLVLPETTLRDAGELASKLEVERIALASRAEGWLITFSVTSWNKGDDTRKLLSRLGYKRSDSPA